MPLCLYNLKISKDLLLLSATVLSISVSLISEPLSGPLRAETLIILSSDINQTLVCSTPTRGADYCDASFSCLSLLLCSSCLKVVSLGNCQAKLTHTKKVSITISYFHYKLIYLIIFCLIY